MALYAKKNSTRLQWETKPRRAVNPRDIEFQIAEIVIPNPARDQQRITSFTSSTLSNGIIDQARMNRLVWGDNLLAMQALLSSGYEGKFNLIYIDPPFWTGENYYAKFEIEGKEMTKSPSLIERLAYKDIWEGGIDSFLDMLYPRLQLMRRLLSDSGSIFVHIDQHVGHYLKVILDEIFGLDNFRNQIIWRRTFAGKTISRNIPSNADMIFWYTKSENYYYNPVTSPLTQKDIDQFTKDDGDGRGKYATVSLQKVAGPTPGTSYDYVDNSGRKFKCPTKGWRMIKSKLKDLENDNRLYLTDNTIREKYYLNERLEKGKQIDNLWIEIGNMNRKQSESVQFPTQKPEELVERIIKMTAKPNSLIADFFCGSGTTMVVAERNGHRWIGCDFSKVAIQVSRNRLVVKDAMPFLLENIGNYQRQLIYLGGSRICDIQTVVLKLYGAVPRKDIPDLGTRKVEDKMELVYVSYPDRPVTAKKVSELEQLAEHLDGRGYHRLVILGWDYEYNYDEILHERERASKQKWQTEVISKSIPPEVYEYLKRAKTIEDIDTLSGKVKFHDKPYMKLLKPKLEKATGKNWNVTVGIDRYVVFDFPIEKEESKKEIQEIVRDKPLSLIDYWAVDWDYDEQSFRSSWQAMRRDGNKIVTIPKTASKELEAKRLYNIAVRVVDVFGNDAASTIKVDLRGMS